jgi:hypothetical protein
VIERVLGQLIWKVMRKKGCVIGEYVFREVCPKRDLTVEHGGRRY